MSKHIKPMIQSSGKKDGMWARLGESGQATGSEVHGLSDMPGHLIRRMHQAAVALFMEKTADWGVTPLQFATLSTAARFPGIDQRSLARWVAIDPSTIGEVIKRLEGRGLLERADGTEDRRVKHITLTDAGSNLLQEIEPMVAASQAGVLSSLSEGEQAIFLFLLRKLALTDG